MGQMHYIGSNLICSHQRRPPYAPVVTDSSRRPLGFALLFYCRIGIVVAYPAAAFRLPPCHSTIHLRSRLECPTPFGLSAVGNPV